MNDDNIDPPTPTSFECPVCHKDKEKWELDEDHGWACAGCVEEGEINATMPNV